MLNYKLSARLLCLIRQLIYVAYLLPMLSHAASSDLLIEHIRDQKLHQCIIKTMRNNGWTSANQVKFIKCHNQDIISAEGINQFSNIHTLSLYKNKIPSIEIEKLSHLEIVNLANNQLNEFSLSGLTKLKKLYLFRNNLSQLSLSDLSSLTQIKANNNQLEQLTIGSTPKLEKLYLFNNQLESVELKELTQLHYLDVRQNPMPDEFYDFLDEQTHLTARHDGNADDWE